MVTNVASLPFLVRPLLFLENRQSSSSPPTISHEGDFSQGEHAPGEESDLFDPGKGPRCDPFPAVLPATDPRNKTPMLMVLHHISKPNSSPGTSNGCSSFRPREADNIGTASAGFQESKRARSPLKKDLLTYRILWATDHFTRGPVGSVKLTEVTSG